MRECPVSHFTLDELIRSEKAKELGIKNIPSLSVENNLLITMAGLERIRAMIDKPMQVLSGYRSPALNVAVKGSLHSQHMLGQACDFISPQYGTPKAIAGLIAPWMDILGVDQLIYEQSWVHVSFVLQNPRYEALTFRDGKYLPGIV